jgi:hypothetical protein
MKPAALDVRLQHIRFSIAAIEDALNNIAFHPELCDALNAALGMQRALLAQSPGEDVERYRWLRTAGAWETESTLGDMTPEEFDRAVDAARKRT